MDKAVGGGRPRLADELVGSLVRLINANLVHVRLKETGETTHGQFKI